MGDVFEGQSLLYNHMNALKKKQMCLSISLEFFLYVGKTLSSILLN